MPLQTRDREFRLTKISYLDFKLIEMDRVLTSFLARLWHGGYPSRIRDRREITVKHIVEEFLEHPEWFSGFQQHPQLISRWIETHLMDMVNRGRPNQAIAAPRPLHGFTYRFRNVKRSRPYGADEHLYEMLSQARGNRGISALEHLKTFFFPNIDPATHQTENKTPIDVETQALLRLMNQPGVREDAPDDSKKREQHPPLCVGSADLLADDILRLLLYQSVIPRSVMVEYFKILLGFHLALYHLRLIKLLPTLVKRKSADPICKSTLCPMKPQNIADPHGDCPHRIGLLLDVANRPGTAMAGLAERSADTWFRRIPGFIKAYYSVRKLDEFADYLAKQNKLTRSLEGFRVGELLSLLESMHKGEREPYFKMRLAGILEDSGGKSEEIAPEIQHILDMGLSAFDSYIEILMTYRGNYHRGFIVRCLDSLLLKNRPGAAIAQPRTKNAARRFVLDSQLLEVLLQIAVLCPGGEQGYYSEPLRIEDLLTFLRERYGLYIDRLPPGDGFTIPSIEDRAALRQNLASFTSRLREIGFYQDLSDAYVTQTVTPRYTIAKQTEQTSPTGVKA